MGVVVSTVKHVYRQYMYSPVYWRFYFRPPPCLTADVPMKLAYNDKAISVAFYPSTTNALEPMVGVALYLHAPHYCLDDLHKELQLLADQSKWIIVAWEYPGYGTLRRDPSNVKDNLKVNGRIPVNFEALCHEAVKVWDQVNSDYSDSLPRAILSSDMASCFAFHIMSQRPKAKLASVLLHDPWSRWDDYWFKGRYWLLWMAEPRLFDSIELIKQNISPDDFPSTNVVICIGKKNKVMPWNGYGGEVATVLQEQFGEDELGIDQEPRRRVRWYTMAKWDQHVKFQQVVKGFFVKELCH